MRTWHRGVAALRPPRRRVILESPHNVREVERLVRASMDRRSLLTAELDRGRRDAISGNLILHRLSAFPLPKDRAHVSQIFSLRARATVRSRPEVRQLYVRVRASALFVVLVPFVCFLDLYSGVAYLVTGKSFSGLLASGMAGVLIFHVGLAAIANNWTKEVHIVDNWLDSLNAALGGGPEPPSRGPPCSKTLCFAGTNVRTQLC